jgi:hypothetical protein
LDELLRKTGYCRGTGAMPDKGAKSGGPLPCLSTFEQEYMTEHAEELQRGLDILQSPGCFPHGVYVVAAG